MFLLEATVPSFRSTCGIFLRFLALALLALLQNSRPNTLALATFALLATCDPKASCWGLGGPVSSWASSRPLVFLLFLALTSQRCEPSDLSVGAFDFVADPHGSRSCLGSTCLPCDPTICDSCHNVSRCLTTTPLPGLPRFSFRRRALEGSGISHL